MHARKTAVATIAAFAALLGAAGSAAADGSAPTTGTATGTGTAKNAPGDGARALCKRAPKIDARIDRALARLNGAASERGSIARLEKRVDAAKAAGHTAVETYLNDKLTFRKSLVPTLKQRQTDLKKVVEWCQANNNGTAS